MHLVIVGVTGLVGQKLLEVLEEVNFPYDRISFVASEASVGKLLLWKGQEHRVERAAEVLQQKPDVAIFSAGAATSLEWAPQFAGRGCYVIDNSSAWRMDPACPLVVPEVNSGEVRGNSYIIANPNCSTIQMVVALHPIHKVYGISRLVISTYQSFTGTGMKAVRQYEAERDGNTLPEPRAYVHPIFENCIPQCDVFMENGYTKEEMKLVNETQKILGDPAMRITATAVRVPVHGGHSESINAELKSDFDIEDIRSLLKAAPGVVVLDDPSTATYPTPLQSQNRNEVFVGRIRRDPSTERAINLWVTADNLRKGAATNAVQIAQLLLTRGLVR
ncbi:MAG: aspartate-semialdehyde dehydrogenase [Saprospiraceae bacterium]|jgi:aspartate-semialdehyde dehydrogenase|nr:aspartate-semialdehyde dehydrogenase [Saprospiraceae bacterium]MBP9209584.1 aspartate-semialdehyde dehydrogenase [Saprospiraceae bacterium]